jgi:aldehyde dehydrogenase (NAD+)
LFINNKFVKAVDGKTFESINPANGKVICSVQEATEKDVDIAVDAARKVYDDYNGPWRSMTPQARGQLLQKLGELFYREIETLAAVEALDNGKAFAIAKGDVAMSADCLKYYGGWSDKIHGKVIETDDFSFRYTRHESIGVCGQIIPWNFPLLMWAWKIGPAVATGNVVVLKTAEQTPLSALVAAKLIVEAGFPPGVINIISGFGKTAGAAISSHMGVDKVAFTGSTITGRSIMKAAADSNLKKVTLELGGKSPTIVFNDADLDAAIDWANFGIYFNHGQCCCAGSRIYVQEDIYEKFVERFTARAKKNVVGDPFESTTIQGPQVSELQFTKIMDYIKSGKDEGATINLGGERHGKEGYFIQPTIFTDVNEKMKIMQEEIFGPVVAIAKFKDVEDVLAKAHDTFYGLAASVHTQNLNTAVEVSNRLQAGSVWVNCHNFLSHQMPFGGFKQSGIGRELGKYALSNYTNVKSVHINLNMKAPF